MLLTERREHLNFFVDALAINVKYHRFIWRYRAKTTGLLDESIEINPVDEERLIIATGRYLGEGFDDTRLDTLLLVLQIAWRRTVAQYAGRLHCNYDLKRKVII